MADGYVLTWMFWTIGQFPELDHLEPHERAHLLRQVPWSLYTKIITRYFFVGVVGGLCAVAIVERMFGYANPVVFIAASILVLLAGYLFELQRMRRSLRRTILHAYRGERLPFCMYCGYDLRAAATNKCPECGRGIVVK